MNILLRSVLALLLLSGCAAFRLPRTGEADWQRLPTQTDIYSDPAWFNLVWDTQRSQAIATTWSNDLWCFTGATHVWAVCGQRGPHSDFHNNGADWDPVNDRYWFAGSYATGYWDRKTGAYTERHTDALSLDVGVVYDPTGRRLIGFGGWSLTPIATLALDPIGATWIRQVTAGGPTFATDAAKMTHTRVGWDAQRAQVWYVDTDWSLWTIDPATLAWTRHVTTGVPPHPNVPAVFTRHEARDLVVAWIGVNQIPAGGGTEIGETWVLERASLGWRRLETPTTPPIKASAANALIDDKAHARVLLSTGSNYARETWALTFTTPPPEVVFPNPASQVALTLTDEPSGGVTPGPCALPAAGQWSACPLPALSANAAPFSAEGNTKDVMWAWDSTRQELLFGMGDFTNSYFGDSGNQSLYAYNAATNTWRVVSTFCHAAGQVTPNHPSDYGIMVYDPTRDRVWWGSWDNGYPPGYEGQPCPWGAPGWPTGSIHRNGIMTLNPATNTWTKIVEQPTWSIGGSAFDPTGDQILNIEDTTGDPGSGQLLAWDVTTVPLGKRVIASFNAVTPSPAWTGSTGGWVLEYAARVKWAWDPVDRIAYVPVVYRRVDAAGTRVESGTWMVTVHVATGAIALKARAPIPLHINLDPYSVMSVFDTTHRRVIYSVTSDACAQVHAVLVYDPATETWASREFPAGLHGGTLGYDPVRDVTVWAGSVFCSDYKQQNLHLFRDVP
jgi:hypothetical protein